MSRFLIGFLFIVFVCAGASAGAVEFSGHPAEYEYALDVNDDVTVTDTVPERDGIQTLPRADGVAVFGGVECNVIVGTDGDDYLLGSGRRTHSDPSTNTFDLMLGFGGNDTLRGYKGDDVLFGGGGNDKLYGDNGDDHLFGEAGNDTLYPGAHNDFSNGGDDNDLIVLADPTNTVDEFYGGAGMDKLLLQDGYGNFQMIGCHEFETFIGGSGHDFVDWSDATVAVILRGNGGDDTLKGGSGNDLLTGGDGNDMLYGNAGADTLYGNGGTNHLFGGAGNDSLRGGASDYVHCAYEPNTIRDCGTYIVITDTTGTEGQDIVHGCPMANILGPDTVVPNVVGMPQAQAEAAIIAMGLTVGVVTEEYSGTIPIGSVKSQTPTAGTSLNFGWPVELVVSLGPVYHALTYLAGENGSIAGTSQQSVLDGAAGEPVTAVANEDYHFVEWSDGLTDNPRTDTNVTHAITVTASFLRNFYPEPTVSTIHGRIVVPEGTPLDPTGFRLISASGEATLNENWEFTDMPVWDVDAGQFLFVEDSEGKSLLLIYIPPENISAADPLILKTDDIVVGMFAMNPVCFAIDDRQRRELIGIAKAHEDYPDLVLLIDQALLTSPTLLSDYDSFPAIYELAAGIINDAAMEWQDSQEAQAAVSYETMAKMAVGRLDDPHLEDWPNNGMTLINPHLLFYGVQWGNGADQWTVLRGQNGLTQLIPPSWSPDVEKQVRLNDGNYIVEFWKGHNYDPSNPARHAAARANMWKFILLTLDAFAPPGYNLITGMANNNDLIEFWCRNESVEGDGLISDFEALNISSGDDHFAVARKVVQLLVNDGKYEGSPLQKIVHVFYRMPEDEGLNLFRLLHNACTWTNIIGKVTKVYNISNVAPYYYQTFFYPEHYLYQVNVNKGILTVGFVLAAPAAKLTASTSQATIGQAVTFDASSTTDNQDALSSLQFRFDFNGDGTWDTLWATGNPNKSHTYTTVGSKVCLVEVKDSDGLTAQAQHSLYVRSASTGTISIDVTPNSGQWRLVGPGGFASITGAGDRTGGSAITGVPVGAYTLLCYDNIVGYDPPGAPTLTLNPGGTVTFAASWGEENDSVEQTIMLPGNVPLVMVWIPGGTFMMGRNSNEQDSTSTEDPRHYVSVPGFWMAKYELTKRQWQAVMETTPWSESSAFVINDPDSPAVCASWMDAHAFIDALNSYSGLTFRLPSESEWEYACRAGATTRFYWGDDPNYSQIGNFAWYRSNSFCQHTVGRKLPNALGLYDMSGNVWEWCEDQWHEYYRGTGVWPNNYGDAPTDGSAWMDRIYPLNWVHTVRGGSWLNGGDACRSANRSELSDVASYPLDFRYCGFRLAR